MLPAAACEVLNVCSSLTNCFTVFACQLVSCGGDIAGKAPNNVTTRLRRGLRSPPSLLERVDAVPDEDDELLLDDDDDAERGAKGSKFPPVGLKDGVVVDGLGGLGGGGLALLSKSDDDDDG